MNESIQLTYRLWWVMKFEIYYYKNFIIIKKIETHTDTHTQV